MGRRRKGVQARSTAALLVIAVLGVAADLNAQEPPPPPPPPPFPSTQGPPPTQVLPAIPVPSPFTIPAPGRPGSCVPADPAPSTNPFWPVLPPPAGPPLADTPQLLVDFWAIGKYHLSDSPSQFTQSKLAIAYDFRVPLGPLTLGARPEFDVMFLAGPTFPGPNAPPEVYGLSVTFEAEYRVGPKFSVRASVQPGLFTDFNNTSNMFRIPAQITAAYALTPQIVLVGGVMYTGQPRWSVLPVAGVVWMPNDHWHLEVTFPRARAVYRLNEEIQVYGILDLYGETYAIRQFGINDVMQYRDLRLGVGAEWTTPIKVRLFAEFGGAFARRLEFENQFNHNVDSGVYLRVGGRW
jgi:hypothetical protein